MGNKESIGRVERLNSYNLSKITAKFGQEYNTVLDMPEQVLYIRSTLGENANGISKELETEFKKLVTLILIDPSKPVAPSRPVDMYWHLFMLDTVEYRKFCDEVVGRFLDHAPSTKETKHETDAIGADTMLRYRRMFGEPNKTIWEAAQADCSTPSNCSTPANCSIPSNCTTPSNYKPDIEMSMRR